MSHANDPAMLDLSADAPAVLVAVLKHRTLKAGEGFLKIVDVVQNGNIISSAFTLDSLASVLGLPRTTIEGRYARSRLCHWKVDVRSSTGRPARGFPVALLQQVIDVIRTPGAVVKTTPTGQLISTAAPQDRVRDALVPIYENGQQYFSMGALAAHFGVSETTVRKRLTKAGLTRRLITLSAGSHGGRPRRAFAASALGDVKLAMESGAIFATQLDAMIARTGGAGALAKAEMAAAIVSHTPPTNPIRAYDHDTMSPATGNLGAWLGDLSPGELGPVNVETPTTPSAGIITGGGLSPEVLRSVGLSSLDELDRLVDEAMAAAEQRTGGSPATVNPVNPPLEATALVESTAPMLAEGGAQPGTGGFDTMPTDADARAADEAERVATLKAMRGPALAQMIAQIDEPTAEEIDDMVFALALEGDDAQAFLEELAAGRAARKGA